MTTHSRDTAQLDRLTFFSDAVFAIAITLLVIEIRPPEIEHATDRALAQALVDLIPQYIGFVLSFLVVGRLWLRHHRAFGMLTRVDATIVSRNLLLLLVVAFIPFPTAVLSEHAGVRVAVCFYAGWLIVAGLLNVSLLRYAMGRVELRVPETTDAQAAQIVRGAWASVAIGTLAFVLALIAPPLGLVPLIGSPAVIWLFERERKRR